MRFYASYTIPLSIGVSSSPARSMGPARAPRGKALHKKLTHSPWEETSLLKFL
jgi:hypothetical protein